MSDADPRAVRALESIAESLEVLAAEAEARRTQPSDTDDIEHDQPEREQEFVATEPSGTVQPATKEHHVARYVLEHGPTTSVEIIADMDCDDVTSTLTTLYKKGVLKRRWEPTPTDIGSRQGKAQYIYAITDYGESEVAEGGGDSAVPESVNMPEPGTRQYEVMEALAETDGSATSHELTTEYDISHPSPALTHLHKSGLTDRENIGGPGRKYTHTLSGLGEAVWEIASEQAAE